jgi:hypothetical protein
MNKELKMTVARCLIPALIACGAGMTAKAGAQTAPKQYTLFMGANISVDLDKGIYPVRDVNGSSWVVDMNGQQKVVSGKEGPINLKIVPFMKLTEVSATIADFKRAGTYTYANDPAVKLTKGMSQAAGVGASYQAAANQESAINPTFITAGASDTSTTATNILAQNSAGDASQTSQAGAVASVAFQGKQETSGFDAMSVEFEVSSAKPLEDPYVVTMTRFHPPGSEPGTVQSLVYAKAIDPIGATPTKVSFSEEGFPQNYEVVDFQLHLYNGGIEVATNVADKREVMTPDQAFDYVKRTYIEAHKGDTLHAVPVMGELPADLASHLEGGKYPGTIYVRVTRDGLAGDAFSDMACSQKIQDPYLVSVVRNIRFKPALADGKPVEGVASVSLVQPGT